MNETAILGLILGVILLIIAELIYLISLLKRRRKPTIQPLEDEVLLDTVFKENFGGEPQ